MNSTDLSVLKTAVAWLQAGERIAIATVVQTWGSSPRPVGSWLVMRADGQVAGSVSGGCIEDDLMRRVQTEILTRSTPELVIYGVSQAEAARFGLPCGGTLRLLVEPRPQLSILENLLKLISNQQIVRRIVNVQTGESILETGARNDLFTFAADHMQTSYGPRWRMILIGAAQLSLYLADFAIASDFEVIMIDPREEYAAGLEASLGKDNLQFIQDMPDDALLTLAVDPHTAVVALTHDPKLDDMALIEALKSPAFYVGALGSHTNNQKRKARLREFDLTQAQVDRLFGPVGLAIGALTPPEIAIAIMAEIIAVQRGVAVPLKRL
ncbi:XdhC family protein [Polynucleobacter sp. IMCC30063]|uniref:XdhC family protein n=1 Tax=unclassified Polynucleobacter TaxID=2640945 RepID=UPI001F23F04F|nr:MULTISPECIES: XdhC family protein [unclassified Polynucleobacter]MCE7506931.1 XdhC family protein [Polynucleobacter sp. IMCC30063]MCE7527448.1 XdhC family protein [Polynucleobacter sp. IMCC 30228]MCE7528687.1 XdhC family protein [Polynucleobacter sp. IMCC 29146]